MFYNVLKAKDLVDVKDAPMDKRILMECGDKSLNLIALKKHEIMDNHISICDAAIYVLEGEIEMHFEAEKFKINKGEILMFKKDDEHKVLALKDSKFFVIKI